MSGQLFVGLRNRPYLSPYETPLSRKNIIITYIQNNVYLLSRAKLLLHIDWLLRTVSLTVGQNLDHDRCPAQKMKSK